MKKRFYFFHSLVVAMVDTTRDAFDNIGTSLKDVVGTVVFLLVAVAKVVSTRDALKNNGTFMKMSTITVTSTRNAFVNMGTYLEDVVGTVVVLLVTVA